MHASGLDGHGLARQYLLSFLLCNPLANRSPLLRDVSLPSVDSISGVLPVTISALDLVVVTDHVHQAQKHAFKP